MRILSLNAAMNCERREQQTFLAERYLNPIRNSTMIHWSGYNWKRLRLSAVLLARNRFKSLVIAAQMSLQLNCLVIVPSELFEHVAWSSLMPWKAWNHIKWNVCYITAAQCVRRHPFSRGACAQSSSLETASSSLKPQKPEAPTNCLIQKHFHLCSNRLRWNKQILVD